jgi:serine/threonine protein kinase
VDQPRRDLKPGNLLLTAGGKVKLADFGLAQPRTSAPDQSSDHGRQVGTPHYMSPEQCKGERADVRSDVYALGATYYALLTGRPPFPIEGAVEVMVAHLEQAAPDPRAIEPSIPEGCSALLARALAKDPAARHADAAALLAELEALLTRQDQTPAAPAAGGRRGCAALLAAGVLAGAALIWALFLR